MLVLAEKVYPWHLLHVWSPFLKDMELLGSPSVLLAFERGNKDRKSPIAESSKLF